MNENQKTYHMLPARNSHHLLMHRHLLMQERKVILTNGTQLNMEQLHLYLTRSFKTMSLERDKEGHDVWIKGSIFYKDITIINIWHEAL